MSDSMGVLGESAIATVGTVTAYTCPTSKAAKFRLMFRAVASGAGGSIIEFFVNGASIAKIAAMTADYYVFSTKGGGLRVAEQAAAPDGTTAAKTVAPADQIYYVSQGDTVQYNISGAALAAMNFQVVGVELDQQ